MCTALHRLAAMPLHDPNTLISLTQQMTIIARFWSRKPTDSSAVWRMRERVGEDVQSD